MTDPIERSARAAAQRLTAQYGPGLPVDVGAALHTRGAVQRPERYVDPVSLASLIVSVAALAWTVYNDLRAQTAEPSPAVVARTIRVQLSDTSELDPAQRDCIIDIVVEETVQTASTELTTRLTSGDELDG
ncbi:MAG TPA: hypothetical protein VFQ77_19100 [Pseudonocardiaceae bacterium]|jgi:hypothetical protein|nr:hypothetical protein [Pseudonocardiaceae bacterium]